MTHNFNSLVKFGLGLFMAGSASLILKVTEGDH